MTPPENLRKVKNFLVFAKKSSLDWNRKSIRKKFYAKIKKLLFFNAALEPKIKVLMPHQWGEGH
jgi:hypothetical protein